MGNTGTGGGRPEEECSEGNPPEQTGVAQVSERPDDGKAARKREAEKAFAELRDRLRGVTPRLYVMPLVIATNVVVFVAMVASGVHFMDPSIESLLKWGADFGPNTLGGEWWRLFTCAFIHIGIIHLLLNMWVLKEAGSIVERMFGNSAFAVVYLLSGFGSSLASIWWNPWVVSAGASGAVFGVYGALLAFMVRQKRSVQPMALSSLWTSTLGFVGYNVVYGFAHAGIDNAAHLGGLATGFLAGLVLARPLDKEAHVGTLWRSGSALFGGGAIFVVFGFAIPRDVPHLQRQLDRFAQGEAEIIRIYNDGLDKTHTGGMTPEEFADLLEEEVAPRWKAMAEGFPEPDRFPRHMRDHLGKLKRYIELRRESAATMARAFRADDERLARKAAALQAQAERLAAQE